MLVPINPRKHLAEKSAWYLRQDTFKFVFYLKNCDFVLCLSLQERTGCLNTNITGQLLSIKYHHVGGIHRIQHVRLNS